MKATYKSIIIRTSLCVICALSLSSCYGNLDVIGMVYGQSPRSDVRFEDSMHYNDSAGYKTLIIPEDEYLVYYSTDMHVDTNWNNLTTWSSAYRNDPDCYFAIILGDIINSINHYDEFMQGIAFNPETQAKDKPLFCTVGNHDLYYNQWAEYLKYWHTSTYYFIAQTPNYKDLFICMDSGDGTWGRKQFDWLKQLLAESADENYRHITLFTHTHIFKRDKSQGHTSNYTLEETYEIMDILSRYNVEWYVSGHCHSRDVADYKGVKYIIVDTMEEPAEHPCYMIASFGKDITYKFVDI